MPIVVRQLKKATVKRGGPDGFCPLVKCEYCDQTIEPGSDGRVLANSLGITDAAEMDEAELALLLRLYEEVLPAVDASEVMTSAMICE